MSEYLNGSFSNRTVEWYHFIGQDANLSQQAYSDLLNDTLRSLDKWYMSPIEVSISMMFQY